MRDTASLIAVSCSESWKATGTASARGTGEPVRETFTRGIDTELAWECVLVWLGRRDEADGSGLVGSFVVALVLVVKLEPEATREDVVRADVAETVRERTP